MDKRKSVDRPDKKLPETPTPTDIVPELDSLILEEQDWEVIKSGSVRPTVISESGDLRYDDDQTAESLEEEDDNPYQNSDEALPDDEEEAALARNPGKEGGRFDEI